MCIISYLSYLHQTSLSSTNSLISVNSHCSSHNGLFSPFPPYSFMFYFLPFLSFFSWSNSPFLIYAIQVYFNLIPQVFLSPWKAVALSFVFKSLWKVAYQTSVSSWELPDCCLPSKRLPLYTSHNTFLSLWAYCFFFHLWTQCHMVAHVTPYDLSYLWVIMTQTLFHF